MKYGLNLAEDGRILSACVVNVFTPAEMPKVDALPEGDINNYKYIDGNFVYDKLPEVVDNSQEIARLKSELASTDYQAIKYAEGWYTDEEYAPIKAQREQLREQIRRLEE